MRRLILVLALALGVLVGVPGTAHASECTFTGTVSTDWNEERNWDCGGVPTEYDNVIIPVDAEAFKCYVDGFLGPLVCPQANSVIIEEGATLFGGDLLAGEITLDGGTISGLGFDADRFRFNGGTITGSEFNVEAMEFHGGAIESSVSWVGLLTWPGGTLVGSLTAGSASLAGAADTVVYDGRLTVAGTATFSDAGATGTVPRLLLGNTEDQPALVTLKAIFRGDWAVEEYQGEVGWQAQRVEVPLAGTSVEVSDLTWDVSDLAVAPDSVVRMSGGEFRPKMGAKTDSSGRALLACTFVLSKACEGSTFNIESAGRLETGAPWDGGTIPRSTQVILPAKWALSRTIWTHYAGDVRNDKTWDKAYRASVEPVSAAAGAPPTEALFELLGGKIDGVAFPGGGPTRPRVGVDVDILGSDVAIRIGNLNIGSDATLSSTDPIYVSCEATFLIEASGSMAQDSESYLGGCNDESMIRNDGVWKALEGGLPHVSETKFLSTGTLDLTEASLELSDLNSARVQGRIRLAYDGYGRGNLYVTDTSPIALGSPSGDPLIVSVATPGSGLPGGGGAPNDGDSIAVVDYESLAAVSGPVRVDPETIRPGLVWTASFDVGGLRLTARQGNTVTALIRTNGSIPCSAPCTIYAPKGGSYSVSWKISSSGLVPDLKATIGLPAKTKVVRAINMQCSGRSTLSCAVGKVGEQGASKVITLKLRSAKVGRYALTGELAGQGLAGDLSMQRATVVVR